MTDGDKYINRLNLRIAISVVIILVVVLSLNAFLKDGDFMVGEMPALVQDVINHEIAIVVGETEYISSTGIGIARVALIDNENREVGVIVHEELSKGDTVEVVSARVYESDAWGSDRIRTAHKVVSEP